MCHVLRLTYCLLIVATAAGAQDQCGSAKPLNACELAQYYEALAVEMLPVVAEDLGIVVKVLSATADGPQIVLRAKTVKSLKGLEKLLAEQGKSLQDMQTYWKSDAFDGICGSIEGPGFLSAGGSVGIVIASADRKPILNFVVQSCAGT